MRVLGAPQVCLSLLLCLDLACIYLTLFVSFFSLIYS